MSASGRTNCAANPQEVPANEMVRCNCQRNSLDRKSTRLNSSHVSISYAVFCLKEKKKITINETVRQFRSIYLHTHPVNEVLSQIELHEQRKRWFVKLSVVHQTLLSVYFDLVQS